MTPSLVHSAALTCHPGTHCQTVRGIEARVRWMRDGALSFTYALKGDLSRLRIPPPGRSRRTDRLWEHTCFEAFVSVKEGPAYYEFNFAPSGEWGVYAFTSYRQSAPLVDEAPAPVIAVRSAGDTIELDAVIGRDRMAVIPPGARLRLALSAVIEEEPGMLSYWALKHPPGKPDFHHPAGFALEIEPPDGDAVSGLKMEKR